jgi:hypothetical protein
VQLKAVPGAMEQIHASNKIIQAALKTSLVEISTLVTVLTQQVLKTLNLHIVQKDSLLMDGNQATITIKDSKDSQSAALTQ